MIRYAAVMALRQPEPLRRAAAEPKAFRMPVHANAAQMSRPHLAEREIKLYRLLVEHAWSGAGCPSNEELCVLLGIEEPSVVSRMVAVLETERLITVKRAHRGRIVTIPATGQNTAPIGAGRRQRSAPRCAR